jgi:hypothetical protein
MALEGGGGGGEDPGGEGDEEADGGVSGGVWYYKSDKLTNILIVETCNVCPFFSLSYEIG